MQAVHVSRCPLPAFRRGALLRPVAANVVSSCPALSCVHRGAATDAAPVAEARGGSSTIATPGGDEGQAQRLRWALGATGSAAALGGLAFWAASRVKEVNIPIIQITEEVFDTSDNLFVFFLDRSEDLLERKQDIQNVIRTLMHEEPLHRLTFYYNVRKEGDPPVPDGSGLDDQGPSSAPPLRCVMYKGQRKTVIRVGAEVPIQKIIEFFSALSEQLSEAMRKAEVARVSGQTFKQEVLMASSPSEPVLLQMYEDTCFLCFLMRPFVNSLARLFVTHKVPLRFKRLNIEKNDFPDKCPVARGTPTFALFRGEGIAASKLEEFKPKDLVERLLKEFPHLSNELFEQMDELQGLVSRRFQLFTQLVMWTIELQKLEALLAAAPSSVASDAAVPAAEATQSAAPDEDSAFSAVVSEMMAKDMRRTDLLLENLEHLQREVDEVEHDAALMGVMLAELVLKREKAEEELLARQTASRRRWL